MLIKVAGMVRGLFAANYPESDEDKQIILNNRGDQIVAQGLPELTELVRLGDSWQVALATGLAAATALPTTTAGLSLYNGETATGKCYAIDSFGSVEEVIDATQADTTALFVCNNALTVTAPTNASLTIRSLSGRAYGGKARTVSGATITNDGWFAHGPQSPLAPAVAGANWKVNEAQVRGLYLVPPGGQFNVIAVKAGAAAAAQQFYFVRWHEVQLIWKS
jgi:hypothetical protein